MYICHVMRMNVFLRALVWLSRIGYCRGFGVQSPWAYSFVRYVVNEHFPYYKYEEIEERFPDIDAVDRKLGKFYLRLANYVQPMKVVEVSFSGKTDDYVEAYVHAGCERCDVSRVSCNDSTFVHVAGNCQNGDGNSLYMIDEPRFSNGDLNKFLSRLKNGDFVVIGRTWKGRHGNKAWMDETTSMQGVLVFDLFYCCVIYVDRKRYTHKYIINF